MCNICVYLHTDITQRASVLVSRKIEFNKVVVVVVVGRCNWVPFARCPFILILLRSLSPAGRLSKSYHMLPERRFAGQTGRLFGAKAQRATEPAGVSKLTTYTNAKDEIEKAHSMAGVNLFALVFLWGASFDQ